MGEKVDARFDFGFEQVEDGLHVFTIQEPKFTTYEVKGDSGVVKGYNYQAKCLVDGGPSDGLAHFEFFSTRIKNDGKKSKAGDLNRAGIASLNGFLIKLGVRKNEPLDSDEVEQERFGKKWETLTGKQIGIYTEQYKDRDNKTRTRSKYYRTIAETLAELKAAPKAEEPKKAESKNTDSWD
jgi:hypothetical protein